MDRRELITAMLAATAATAATQLRAQQHDHSSHAGHAGMMAAKPMNIVLLAYQKMTALDLLGPHHMLSLLMGARVLIVGQTKDPIVSDMGLTIIPDVDFASCPQEVEMILVPGGTQGTTASMRNPELMEFVKSVGARAKYVSSVCTGSLILGKAGLLKGYRATSHWLTVPFLQHFGATPVRERYVFDRNRITGAGVTAGIDTALAFMMQQRGEEYVRAASLLAEYDPAPPVRAGNPQDAGPVAVKMLTEMSAPWLKEAEGLSRST